jgi:7-cyano-7-deazaguanine reductase
VTTVDIPPEELRDAPLGHDTGYPDSYQPGLLYTVPRAPQRAALGIPDALPFTGADLWTAYDLTWLDARGKPQAAIASIEVPAHSPRIVESKSMKLYLGSFAQTRFGAPGEVTVALTHDLALAAGAPVRVVLERPDRFARLALRGILADRAVIAVPGSARAVWTLQRTAPGLMERAGRRTVRRALAAMGVPQG